MTPSRLVAPACLALVLACASTSGAPPPEPASPSAAFSGERAFSTLEQLAALGPRVSGTAANAEARALLRAELEAIGLEVHEEPFVYTQQPEGIEYALTNLWAEVPGPIPGRYAVATPFDTVPGTGTAPLGVNEGGSGAAVLVELARVLQERPLEHPVRLYFLDGELLDADVPFLGSEHAYLGLEEGGLLSDLHLWLYLHQVGDAELEIRRDRLSDRRLRDAFYGTAERLGQTAAFPSSAPFDASRLGHGVFVSHGYRRVVALADLRHGGEEIPGTFWRTIDDDLMHSSAASLGSVGRVVYAGLADLSERQATVDRIRGVAEAR